jgi:hypothetical protein
MFTVEQRWRQGHRSAQLLKDRGGFADALANVYFKADMKNAMRLRDAFPELLQVVPMSECWEPEDLNKAYFIEQFVNFLGEQKNA